MAPPPLYMKLKDYVNSRVNPNSRNRNEFIKKYKLKNNSELNQLINRTGHMLSVARNRTQTKFTPMPKWSINLSGVIRHNTWTRGAVFLKKTTPNTWEPLSGNYFENKSFFDNNKNKIVRIYPEFSNKYPELQSYYIKPNMTLNRNGKYMRPTNYLKFRRNKLTEHEMLKTMRKAKGLEAMTPRLISALKRAQRKSRIREYFQLINENTREPNNPLKRKLQNSNAEKARKKAVANKEAANRAAQNAINAQLAALRNNTRRLIEQNERQRLEAAGSHNAKTWQRNLAGTMTRKI